MSIEPVIPHWNAPRGRGIKNPVPFAIAMAHLGVEVTDKMPELVPEEHRALFLANPANAFEVENARRAIARLERYGRDFGYEVYHWVHTLKQISENGSERVPPWENWRKSETYSVPRGDRDSLARDLPSRARIAELVAKAEAAIAAGRVLVAAAPGQGGDFDIPMRAQADPMALFYDRLNQLYGAKVGVANDYIRRRSRDETGDDEKGLDQISLYAMTSVMVNYHTDTQKLDGKYLPEMETYASMSLAEFSSRVKADALALSSMDVGGELSEHLKELTADLIAIWEADKFATRVDLPPALDRGIDPIMREFNRRWEELEDAEIARHGKQVELTKLELAGGIPLLDAEGVIRAHIPVVVALPTELLNRNSELLRGMIEMYDDEDPILIPADGLGGAKEDATRTVRNVGMLATFMRGAHFAAIDTAWTRLEQPCVHWIMKTTCDCPWKPVVHAPDECTPRCRRTGGECEISHKRREIKPLNFWPVCDIGTSRRLPGEPAAFALYGSPHHRSVVKCFTCCEEHAPCVNDDDHVCRFEEVDNPHKEQRVFPHTGVVSACCLDHDEVPYDVVGDLLEPVLVLASFFGCQSAVDLFTEMYSYYDQEYILTDEEKSILYGDVTKNVQ
jgi:hypothetical protein